MRLESLVDVTVERFETNPLVAPDSDDRIGTNVNGPSVVRAPPWVDDPLGEYYLYFAHHGGQYVRLAYADDFRGPWTVHTPGVLDIRETRFDDHVASPDVHLDREAERVRLYFHGCCGPFDHDCGEFDQATDVATSTDGLDFRVRGETLGGAYFRVWERESVDESSESDGTEYYALASDGHVYRGTDPLAPFERERRLFPRNRHFAVRPLDDDRLQVFLSRRGDRPERLMVAVVDTSKPVSAWRPDPYPPETVLWPERDYEGGNRPLDTSATGAADEPVRALRDPAIFEEEGRTYLFYAVAGERGIAGAEMR